MKVTQLLALASIAIASYTMPSLAGAQPPTQCDPEPTDMQIAPGMTITCEIDPIGDSDLFHFEATNGDAVIVQAAEIAGDPSAAPCIDVFFGGDFVGSECDTNDPRLDLSLASSGTYTIVVYESNNDATFQYNLALERHFPSADGDSPICFGCLMEDFIGPTGDLDLFTFEATAGDAVIVQAAEIAGDPSAAPCISVFFDGGPVESECDTNDPRLDLSLASSGTYTIVVYESNNDATFQYNLALERTQPFSCSAVPICFGCLFQGSIDPVGDIDIFVFSGAPGDFIMITAAETSGGGSANPCVNLFKPDSMQESDCDSNNATLNEPLDQAGFYTLAVTDGNNDATFDYDLNVQCIGACENFVPSCDEIFSDGFESGDTSAWSASQ